MILGLVISTSLTVPVSAGETSDVSFYLWRLINNARRNPVNVLSTMGFDIPSVRLALANRSWILDLEQGLPPLAWNPQLFDSSMAHNQDMIKHLYYSYVSRDGSTYMDRIERAGYSAQIAGETLGIVSFEYYIEPVEAANLIFRNMLKDEIDPLSRVERNILNPDVTEIGISFSATPFEFPQMSLLNVYLVVIDFAKPIENHSYVIGNFYEENDSGIHPIQDLKELGLVIRFLPEGIDVPLFFLPMAGFQFEVSSGFFFIEVRDVLGRVIARRSGQGICTNQLIDLKLINTVVPVTPDIPRYFLQ